MFPKAASPPSDLKYPSKISFAGGPAAGGLTGAPFELSVVQTLKLESAISLTPQSSGVFRAESQRPEANGFARDLNPSG
jgi:hypothetical protein